MERIEDILRLANCNGLGPRTFARLREHFSDMAEVFGASASALAEVEGIGPKLAEAILRACQHDPRPEMELAEKYGVSIVSQSDPSYPAALRETFDPPIVLYVKGSLHRSDAIALSMVGTRQPSQYGRAQAERFASLLARQGFTIVSGLARGVDSVAHRAALTVEGRTIAVLGSGLAHIYPEENRDLAAAIEGGGAVVSEFPMDTTPARENFPRRNRIIAGLGLGTIVVEAPKRSGSLITARLATELGREVFAIPGRIDQRNAEGCNSIIANGQAKLVQALDCILEELGPVADALRPDAPVSNQPPVEQKTLLRETGQKGAGTTSPPEPSQPDGDSREGRILGVMGSEEMHIDEICSRTSLPVPQVSASLMMLELKRAVKQLPGRFFVKT